MNRRRRRLGIFGSAALLLAHMACVSTPERSTPPTPSTPGTVIEVATETRQPIVPKQPYRIAIEGSGLQRLAPILDEAFIIEFSDSRIVFDLRRDARYPAKSGSTTAGRLDSTFVIDWSTKEVETLAREIEDEFGATPTPEEIGQAVRARVEYGLDRGFDLASRVARDRTGDCSEFAVLFTALARRFDHPARVVLGLAVLELEPGRYQGFGHAWAEVAEDNLWRLYDPTNEDASGFLAYIPESYLENEGPGYAVSLLGNLTVRRVEILGPRPEAD